MKVGVGGLCEHLATAFRAMHSMHTAAHSIPVLVIQATAKMVAGWQALGFCHGVLNTDNFTLLGLALDFGPCRSVPIPAWSRSLVLYVVKSDCPLSIGT